MSLYKIKNGKEIYYKEAINREEIKYYAINVCDHSKKITITEGKKDLEYFKNIAKNSKNIDDAFHKIIKIQGVPSEVGQEFRKKYNPEGNLTPFQAFKNFFNDNVVV